MFSNVGSVDRIVRFLLAVFLLYAGMSVYQGTTLGIGEHTGQCLKFWIYETKDGEIMSKKLLELSPKESFHDSSEDEPHPLDDVQILISGGMGQGLVRRL